MQSYRQTRSLILDWKSFNDISFTCTAKVFNVLAFYTICARQLQNGKDCKYSSEKVKVICRSVTGHKRWSPDLRSADQHSHLPSHHIRVTHLPALALHVDKSWGGELIYRTLGCLNMFYKWNLNRHSWKYKVCLLNVADRNKNDLKITLGYRISVNVLSGVPPPTSY